MQTHRPPGSKNRRPATRHDAGRVLAIGEAYSCPAHHLRRGPNPGEEAMPTPVAKRRNLLVAWADMISTGGSHDTWQQVRQ
ncbi:hypothetical protein C5746_00610 [Streptomyces atratus]|uniref:Uncharacterized protein n=1 Tax=Streptomyces atratus TaxID=1893 RepID=A0A2Z5J619_STRAR|nr:hypothetical protein C5746_00610 [Streptomyces atratus]